MAFKHKVKSKDATLDPRISASFKDLFGLQKQAKGFNFMSSNNAGTVMAGRHQSKFRGRGMNFEELRNYQKGDDIRTLDWRVTLRTGKPHVRAYTEEKDHQIVLCIDLRKNMFFSSVDTMKSVVAAEIAAICIWRVLNENDRIGALIITDEEQFWFKPQRSQYQAVKILKILAKQCQYLASPESLNSAPENTATLAEISQQLLKSSSKNGVYIFISDFLDFNDTALSVFKKLKAHNNVLPIIINDPMDTSLKSQQGLVISDGKWQLEIAKDDANLSKRYEEQVQQRQQALASTFKSQDLPIITLGTDGNHIAQFRRYLGVAS